MVEILENELENINKEIRRYEQLNLINDEFYICLQIEKCLKIAELQFCKENNL